MTWDAKSVEREITKAFITRRLDTSNPGPKGYGNNWPDIMRDFADLIGTEERGRRPRIRPGAEDISAADAIFDLINSIEDEQIRKSLYQYHLLRSLRFSKEEIAKKTRLERRKMGRIFALYHQALVKDFLRSDCLRKRGKVDDVPENRVNPRGRRDVRQRENLGKIQGWMEPDARPKAVDFGSTQEMGNEIAG